MAIHMRHGCPALSILASGNNEQTARGRSVMRKMDRVFWTDHVHIGYLSLSPGARKHRQRASNALREKEKQV